MSVQTEKRSDPSGEDGGGGVLVVSLDRVLLSISSVSPRDRRLLYGRIVVYPGPVHDGGLSVRGGALSGRRLRWKEEDKSGVGWSRSHWCRSVQGRCRERAEETGRPGGALQLGRTTDRTRAERGVRWDVEGGRPRVRTSHGSRVTHAGTPGVRIRVHYGRGWGMGSTSRKGRRLGEKG